MRKRRRTKGDVALEMFSNGKTIEDVITALCVKETSAIRYYYEWKKLNSLSDNETKQNTNEICRRFCCGTGVMFGRSTDSKSIWRC